MQERMDARPLEDGTFGFVVRRGSTRVTEPVSVEGLKMVAVCDPAGAGIVLQLLGEGSATVSAVELGCRLAGVEGLMPEHWWRGEREIAVPPSAVLNAYRGDGRWWLASGVRIRQDSGRRATIEWDRGASIPSSEAAQLLGVLAGIVRYEVDAEADVRARAGGAVSGRMKQEQLYPLGEAMLVNLSPRCGGLVSLDGKGLALGLGDVDGVLVYEASNATDVGVLEFAGRLASAGSVTPEQWRRRDCMAEVRPLAPREVAGREVRWEVTPDLWLVHADTDDVYLRRAATGEWEGTAHLSFDEAWRLVQALVGLCRWQQRLAQVRGGSAQEERARLARQLHVVERDEQGRGRS